MKQETSESIYYLLDEEGNVLLKITTTAMPGNQIIIETEREVYAGPIKFISFSDINLIKNPL